MQKNLCLLITVALFSCTSTKLFKEYKLYRRDKTSLYPAEKLTFKFNSDSTGEFVNAGDNRKTFSQHFKFTRVDDDFLIIKEIVPTSEKEISLKQGDSIVMDNKKLHFFYNGDKKYALSFRKK